MKTERDRKTKRETGRQRETGSRTIKYTYLYVKYTFIWS